MPYLEYSRIDLTSRMFSARSTSGPESWKAIILSLSGSVIMAEIWPIGPADCMLRIVVPMSFEPVINIVLL